MKIATNNLLNTMKFQFKIQPFQTEAVENIVRVFNGQPKQDGISYRRDVGKASVPRR